MPAYANRTNRKYHGAALACLLAPFVYMGCTRPVSVDHTSAKENTSEPFFGRARQYDSVSDFELKQLIRTTKQPLLVEFGVDFRCARCDQMTPVLNELDQQFDGQVRIIRTSFNPSSAIQARIGLRQCPSYLLYRNGKLVDRCDGPTMLPVLKSKLSRLVSQNVSHRGSRMVKDGTCGFATMRQVSAHCLYLRSRISTQPTMRAY